MKYKGDAHELLVQALHIMNADRACRIYDNFVPIVQSSGTGKSRIVDEAAKYIFTLPFNLRAARPQVRFANLHSLFLPTDNSQGFPSGNPEVRDLLIDDVNKETSKVVQLRYLYFLVSLFTKVCNKIEDLLIFNCYEDLAQHWHGELSDATHRTALYEDVIKVMVFLSYSIAI